MSKDNSETSAFPVGDYYCGLTKREFFTAVAVFGYTVGANNRDSPGSIAAKARIIGDKTLKELEENPYGDETDETDPG